MKAEEALTLIDNVLASVSGNRADHAKLQEAVAVLRNSLTTKSKE